METPNIKSTPSSSSSHFIKTVCLREWWLVNAKQEHGGKSLAVAGLSSEEQRAVRVFYSAPIIKRHDLCILETTDGVYVVLQGFINKHHTAENGFSSEVFNYFVFGFPTNWEECAGRCLERDGLPSCSPGTVKNDIANVMSKKKAVLEKSSANAKVAVGKRENSAKKKLNYDINLSPPTQEGDRQTSTVSPETLGLKKSRSGRLLLPTLEFWRNQKAVYDVGRQVTGIEVGSSVRQLSRGSGSNGRKKCNRLP